MSDGLARFFLAETRSQFGEALTRQEPRFEVERIGIGKRLCNLTSLLCRRIAGTSYCEYERAKTGACWWQFCQGFGGQECRKCL